MRYDLNPGALEAMTAKSSVKNIVFSLEGPQGHEKAEHLDLSVDKDESVIVWIDGDTVYVSAAEKGHKVIIPPIYNARGTTVPTYSMKFVRHHYMKHIFLEGLDTSAQYDMHIMFGDCWDLEEADLSPLDFSSCGHMEHMFRSCPSLKRIVLPHSIPNDVKASGMFWGCRALERDNIVGLPPVLDRLDTFLSYPRLETVTPYWEHDITMIEASDLPQLPAVAMLRRLRFIEDGRLDEEMMYTVQGLFQAYALRFMKAKKESFFTQSGYEYRINKMTISDVLPQFEQYLHEMSFDTALAAAFSGVPEKDILI